MMHAIRHRSTHRHILKMPSLVSSACSYLDTGVPQCTLKVSREGVQGGEPLFIWLIPLSNSP